jgi:hypothetical protein
VKLQNEQRLWEFKNYQTFHSSHSLALLLTRFSLTLHN